MEENFNNQPSNELLKDQNVTIGEWIVTYLIMAIPLVGFIMLFVWAFSKNEKPSKENWAKAMLIWIAIFTTIYILIIILFGAALINLANI
ncbi:MAG: hypothetical protein JXR68_11300 [Bacteroidales bacterium]|nr:hypothetical protein [Bacteroidales bacterium]